MSSTLPCAGSIAWCDLTTGVADRLRTFYERVAGWSSQPVEMGGYADFNMLDASGRPVAGICHARGVNEGLPAVWLLYVTVADLDESLARCTEEGGAILVPERALGAMGRYAIVADPSGAAVALFEPPSDAA